MTKKRALFVSAVLFGSFLLIEVLKMEGELIDFLSGALFGAGFSTLIIAFVNKKPPNRTNSYYSK